MSDAGIPVDPGDEIRTERLVLRRWRADDLERLAEVYARPEFWHFPFRRGLDETETAEMLHRFLDIQERGEPCLRAVEHSADATLIGFLGLAIPRFLPELLPAVEVGWRLHPDWWGRGLATEGARAAVTYGFDRLGLDQIVSIFETDNVASGRVMDKLGFVHDRHTTVPRDGVAVEVRVLTRDRWSGQATT